jgi:hypothetical protein
MTRVGAFIADLARAGKSFAEIKQTVDAAYGDRSLSLSKFTALLSRQGLEKTPKTSAISTPKNSSHGESHRLRGSRRSR